MKKILLKSLITISTLSLVACGGGGSDSSAENTPTHTSPDTSTPTAIEYRVIDGYLSNANICIIPQVGSTCESVGVTDENGIITIPGVTTAGQIVATIIAGQTQDADGVGFVGRSYQMVADISEDTPNVVTPYTTLDVLDETKSMSDIASYLNLPESVIHGDYVASSVDEKSHVHALARGIATQLATNKDENDIADLYITASAINEYVMSDLANSDVDLDTVNIIVDGEVVTHENAVTDLSVFLENGEVYVSSLNSAFFAMEGVRVATFTNGQVTMNNSTANYKINGDKLIFEINGEKETDQFLYTSSDFSLSVPIADKDLTVMSHTAFSNEINYDNTWEVNDFTGKTFYLLFDDAPSIDEAPEPIITKMEFSETTVKITEGIKTIVSPWEIFRGWLKIDLLEAGVGERNIVFVKSIADENITLIRDLQEGRAPSLLMTEETLAQSIYNNWISVGN